VSPEPGGDNAGIVKNQQIVGVQKIKKITKMVMAYGTADTLKPQ